MTRARLTPARHAHAAGEAVVNLNRATLGPDGYRWPGDVDAVIGGLAEAVMSMEQALRQARRWLVTAETYGEIGHDQDLDVTAAVLSAGQRLDQAAMTSVELGRDLNAVRDLTAHLTGLRP